MSSVQTDGARPLVATLRRLLDSRPRRVSAGDRCEFCGTPVSEDHGHAVSTETRQLMCACRACYLLFTHEGAAHGRYRAVPTRYVVIDDLTIGPMQWDALQIPVSIAFFFVNSTLGRIVSFYPSPAGATESLLPLDVWASVTQGSATIATLTDDVEALLVRRVHDVHESFIVPIDACYELVGRMRRVWKGFDGGEDARREIEDFFSTVRARATGTAVVGWRT